jgi:proteasome accessory factor B
VPFDEQWTELHLPYASGESLADELTSYAADVLVIDPPEVRAAVVNRLHAIAAEQAS